MGEISSIILAGRRLFPNYLRQDMLFGFLFFATRIMFHGYLLYRIGSENVKVNIFPTILAIWALHCYWFSQWCSNKLKRSAFSNYENLKHNIEYTKLDSFRMHNCKKKEGKSCIM